MRSQACSGALSEGAGESGVAAAWIEAEPRDCDGDARDGATTVVSMAGVERNAHIPKASRAKEGKTKAERNSGFIGKERRRFYEKV